MNNKFDLHKLLLLTLTSVGVLAFTQNAMSETKWKVSAKPKQAAAKLPMKVQQKLPAKALAKTATPQAAKMAGKRAPASLEEPGNTASSAAPTAGNPDMPLTATPTGNALATAIPKKLAAIDPNSAVEIRGQARTLSMMLVLKNGKDSINFIKVRKDYRSEIAKTEY